MTALDQIVFAAVEGVGVQPVSGSFQYNAFENWDGWEGKLKLYARLLSEPAAPPPPTESFTHIAFPDATAALVRRSARPGDVGRNTAHALVGERRLINHLVPQLAGWTGWYDDDPGTVKLPPLPLGDLTAVDRTAVADELLVPVVAVALQHPEASYSVVGFPAEPRQRLAAALRLREVVPDREWTFSTHEMNDAEKKNLPKLIFLSASPSNPEQAQPGRVLVDLEAWADDGSAWVAEAHRRLSGSPNGTPPPAAWTDHVEATTGEDDGDQRDEPGTGVSVEPATRPPSAQPQTRPPRRAAGRPVGSANPGGRPPRRTERPPSPLPHGNPHAELDGLLRGDGPEVPRLLRLSQLFEVLDVRVLRQEGPGWVADRAVPHLLAVFLVEHLDRLHVDGLDRAIAARWRADKPTLLAPPGAGDRTTTAPPPDQQLAHEVWRQQEGWSLLANRAKLWVRVCRWFMLLTLVVGAVGAVVGAQLSAVDAALMNAVLATTAMVVLVGTLVRTTVEPSLNAMWTKARQHSETLKSEVYRYLAGADPYRGSDAPRVLADAASRFGTAKVKVKSRSGPPRFTDAVGYAVHRIDGQVEHHQRKATEYQHALTRADMAGIVLALLAALISVIGLLAGQNLLVWVGVCTTITGAIAAHVKQAGYEHLTARYLRTASELRELRRHLPQTTEPLQYNDFVTSCEQVLEQQNKDWLAHLQPAGRGRS